MVNKKTRHCPWCDGVSEAYTRYHHDEWGVPCVDDDVQFEFLILESAQAGLSWSTVLHKREGYRKAFANFDVLKVAKFNARKIDALIANPAIIRNKLKIKAAVTNAQRFQHLQAEFGTFARYIWGFVDGKPKQNRWRRQADVPATSRESDALSKDLKKRGFKFVGSTIMYAHMQATGLVNDHLSSCFRYAQCKKMGEKLREIE